MVKSLITNRWRSAMDAQEFSAMRDLSEVVSDGGEDGVCGIADAAFEVAAADATLSLEVADGTEHAALLTGCGANLGVMTAVVLVDMGALDLAGSCVFWVSWMISCRV
jgi:hypothetical protein